MVRDEKGLSASIAYFLIALFFILNANASPEYIQFVIMSVSMRPTFEVGDVITVQTVVNASQIYAAPYPDGDIIVFHPPTRPDEIIIHRAIQKSYVNGTYYFQTKADANPNPDVYEVPEENIIGKVIAYAEPTLRAYGMTLPTTSRYIRIPQLAILTLANLTSL